MLKSQPWAPVNLTYLGLGSIFLTSLSLQTLSYQWSAQLLVSVKVMLRLITAVGSLRLRSLEAVSERNWGICDLLRVCSLGKGEKEAGRGGKGRS